MNRRCHASRRMRSQWSLPRKGRSPTVSSLPLLAFGEPIYADKPYSATFIWRVYSPFNRDGRVSMQGLTPLDIQKQTFARVLKGYHADEVRGYLHLIAEEMERLVRDLDRLSRENAMLRDELDEHNARERILKDTLLSAQRVSEDVKANAHKEAELIVKDAELLSDRLTSQAMSRVGDLERAIQDLKIERRGARNKLQSMLDTMQQLVMLDAEQEANEQPITAMFRARET